MRSRLWLFAVAAAVAAGAAARIACLDAEFWLDEIWSLELARAASSRADVFLDTKHDNNHHLNTLYLSFCPDGVWWGWYRAHSVLAGVLSIVVAAKTARRWGQPEAVAAAWLTAGCSWLVLAAAEARGYSLCVLFALVAFDALWSYLDTPSRWSLVIYWAATVLGFLSHLTFVYATLGFVVWSLRRYSRQRTSPGDELRRLLLTHGPPGAAVAAFYLVAIRGMEKGGGPPASTTDVLLSLVGQALGGSGGWDSVWVIFVGVLLLVAGIWQLRREGDVWVFFLVTCLLAPGLYLVLRPPYLFERYFFVSLSFLLLLLAKGTCGVGRRIAGRDGTLAGRLSAWFYGTLIVGGILLGNGFTLWRFVQTGRGDFHDAFAWVAGHDAGVIRAAGDHPFRVGKYVNFYGRTLTPGREVVFVEDGDAEWLFVHRLDDRHPPADEERIDEMRYRLAKSYPSRGPGAWGWFVYRRVPKGDVGDQ